MGTAVSRNGWPAPSEFCCHTDADPDRIWAALTDPCQTARYLYGLAAHSSWQPDAAIELRYRGRVRLTGRVLCVRPPERLSYVLSSAGQDPPVYLTWLIRGHGSGSVLRLQIDEVDGSDCPTDAEDTWLPVLAALQRLLNSD